MLVNVGVPYFLFFFFQAEDGIRDYKVTGVQTCALPICPEVDGVDWIIRRLDPHEAQGALDVLGAHLVGDELQGGESDLLGALDASAGGGAQAELELPDVDAREDLDPEPR